MYRNNFNSHLKNAKISYYENKFQDFKNNTRKVWDKINGLIGRKQSQHTIKEVLINNTIIHGEELAGEVNRHFVNVGVYAGTNSNTPSITGFGNLSESIKLFPRTPHEIQQIIKSLDNHVTAGYDEIKVLHVKHVADIVSPILSDIINKVRESGEFPNKNKTSPSYSRL